MSQTLLNHSCSLKVYNCAYSIRDTNSRKLLGLFVCFCVVVMLVLWGEVLDKILFKCYLGSCCFVLLLLLLLLLLFCCCCFVV